MTEATGLFCFSKHGAYQKFEPFVKDCIQYQLCTWFMVRSLAVLLWLWVRHCWYCAVYHWVRQWFWYHTAGVVWCTTESGSDFGATLLVLCCVPLSQAVILVPHCWSCACTTESGSDFGATLLVLCSVLSIQAVILVRTCTCAMSHKQHNLSAGGLENE